jgi:serine phosphatase RsbU (regulator of sigma subunit)
MYVNFFEKVASMGSDRLEGNADEACGATDEQFGDDRLLALLDANPAGALDLCQHTIEAVFAFSERDPKDDLTLLAARLLSC